jgi:hypothetical protein
MSQPTIANSLAGAAAIAIALLMGGCLVVALVYGDRPNAALEAPIAAHDLAAVRRLIAGGGAAARVGVFEVERAAAALTPGDPRSVEILRLILEQPTASPTPLVGGGAPLPANLTLTQRSASGGSSSSTSPAELAARQWSADGLRVLLELGLDVRSVAVSGALVHAASNGCEACITVLLDAGADVNGRDRHGDTALAMARRVGNTAIVNLLTARGARQP